MFNLLLYDRLLISTTNFRRNITGEAENWRCSERALGGYWMAGFSFTRERLSRGEIIDFYNQAIEWRIVEQSYGPITWEGEIVRLILTLDGAQYTRSLDPESWQNKVRVKYPDGVTDWSETTGSSDLYGESCYIDTVGPGYTATAAEARRDRRLAEYAYPRSRSSGGLSTEVESGARLDVTCAGYVFSINRRYRESDTASAAISTQLTTLIGESEFVSAGTIDTNALEVPIEAADLPTRLWDVMEEIIGMGDGSGNEWVGGVYADRVFDYNLAETSVVYYWRNGKVYDLGGIPVLPTHIKPDTVIELVGAPRGFTVMGGTKANRVYIDAVEFIAPNRYRLIPRTGQALEGVY